RRLVPLALVARAGRSPPAEARPARLLLGARAGEDVPLQPVPARRLPARAPRTTRRARQLGEEGPRLRPRVCRGAGRHRDAPGDAGVRDRLAGPAAVRAGRALVGPPLPRLARGLLRMDPPQL